MTRRPKDHLNLKFTISDMDKVAALAGAGAAPAQIAWSLNNRQGADFTEEDVAKACTETGIVVRDARL